MALFFGHPLLLNWTSFSVEKTSIKPFHFLGADVFNFNSRRFPNVSMTGTQLFEISVTL